MAKDIRSLNRYNESTQQTEIFYPATTTDAIAHPTKRKSLTNVISDIETHNGAYDVSAANSGATFASLEALLTDANLSTLIPTSVRKGGMSIKFVQTSDNNYVQYRLKTNFWSINVTDWICEDDIDVKGQTNKSELSITDENFYAILKLLSYILVDKDGNVRTKNFNSAEQSIIKSGLTELANKYANTFPNGYPKSFSVEDENDNAILHLLNYLKVDEDGNIKTKSFDSTLQRLVTTAIDTFSVEDDDDNAILKLLNYLLVDASGNIKTKAFDSSLQKNISDFVNTFSVEDENDNALLHLRNYLKVDKDGNIKTKAFDSSVENKVFIVVDANGNGDYTTIEDALNNAGDTPTRHINILIKEGVYYPAPEISHVAPYEKNYRNLSLIGENRNKCIIRNDIGFYDYTIGTDCTPLRLNGNVTIENLTILSYSTLYRQYYGTPGFVTERADRNSSYCIHRDGYSNEGDEFVIKDCILINDHFTCVGFGLKKNVTLRIEDCYCQSEENEDDSAESLYGVLYGHFDSGKKGLNQNLEVIRCQLVNLSSYQAINLRDAKAFDATPQDTFANLKFISNTVDTTDNANAFVTEDTTEGFYAITKLSFGNKCEAMNYNV